MSMIAEENPLGTLIFSPIINLISCRSALFTFKCALLNFLPNYLKQNTEFFINICFLKQLSPYARPWLLKCRVSHRLQQTLSFPWLQIDSMVQFNVS